MMIEYECPACGHKQTRILKTHKDHKEFCKECESKMDRIPFHATGIIFKGSGWYCKDKGGK